MDINLADRAIKSALAQNWKEAIRLNQELLGIDEHDVDSLNRLAYAHLKSGNVATSRLTYKRVLRLDKYNPIALKNLKWLIRLTKSDMHDNPTAVPTPTIFLEEPRKTKIVTLVHPAPLKVLCNLMTAQKVVFTVRKHAVEVRDTGGIYVGALPDDLAHRLRTLIMGGNVYDVYIKNIENNTVTVFIRELKKNKRFTDVPSFPLLYVRNGHTSADGIDAGAGIE